MIAEMLRQLRGGEVSSRELVETCLVAATDPQGEGSRTYLRTYPEAARREAEAADDRLRRGEARRADRCLGADLDQGSV